VKEETKPADKKPESADKKVEPTSGEEKSVKKIENPKESPDRESQKFEKAIKEKDDAFIDKELEER